MSYYEVLEVDENATENEIKKAYRQKSLFYHPDRNTDPKAKEHMRNINEAYEVLSDQKKRK